jgi:glutamate-1-semialdehyde 2,1-aminomutase
MSALRLARGATGRDRIIKFVGGYHGHADALLVAAGSGATTLGRPSSPGVPPAATADTILLAYNDLTAVERAFADEPGRVAAVLVEPVAGNMGVVSPAGGFLPGLRKLCDADGALLVFDEVMTGFRLGPAGAQGLYGVRPDLTALGKVIGGGLPVGAFGGSAELMANLAPDGPVYQAGTLSGNPLAMAAGSAALGEVLGIGFFDRLEAASARLESGLRGAAAEAGLAGSVRLNRVGSMLCCFFTPGAVTDYASATAADTARYAAWFHAMGAGGVNLAPAQFEAMFVSAAHAEEDIDLTIRAARDAFAAVAGR